MELMYSVFTCFKYKIQVYYNFNSYEIKCIILKLDALIVYTFLYAWWILI